MRIGVDLGGSKIEGIALDEYGREVARRRGATPRHDYLATITAIVELVRWLEHEADATGTVGLGLPGTIQSRTGLVRNANSVWLNGRAFDRDLADALGREVRCANDANCLAVSEAVDGAAAGANVVFAAILGTGIGAGVAVAGSVHAGPNGVAGEWGHNPLPWPADDELPGPTCYCGRRGCIETWVSGSALAQDHLRTTGRVLDGPAIVAAADGSDPMAETSLSRYEDRLARSLAHVVNVLDPDVIVLGGGVSNVARLYETLPATITDWVFGAEFATPIRRALHGGSSGVRGAAWLWPAAATGPGV